MVFSTHIPPPWCRLCISDSFKCLFRLFPLYQILFIFTLQSPICLSGPQGDPLKSCMSFLCSPPAKYSNWGQSSFKLTQCLRILAQRRGVVVSVLTCLLRLRSFCSLWGKTDSPGVAGWEDVRLRRRQRDSVRVRQRKWVIVWGISKTAEVNLIRLFLIVDDVCPSLDSPLDT